MVIKSLYQIANLSSTEIINLIVRFKLSISNGLSAINYEMGTLTIIVKCIERNAYRQLITYHYVTNLLIK